MNQPISRNLKRLAVSSLAAILILTLALQLFSAGPALAAPALPVLWTAGGLSAGTDSAGQAARIAVDAAGNVAVVSGPSGGRDLAVTSYTANGAFRWRGVISPASGTFAGDWVAAAPNGDFVAVGHNQDSRGNPISLSMVRYSAAGAQLWRVDFSASFYPGVARLILDAAGNEYLAWSATGSGQFLQKYSPAGVLIWTQQDLSNGVYAVASSLALSPDGADVVVTGGVSGGATWTTALYDAATGVRRWSVAAAEGTAAKDVVVDASRVYVTGQGVTGAGTPSIAYHLTVVAYNRANGARLWRTDKTPADGSNGTGLRMALAPDGSLVVAGQALRGFLDWYTVSFTTGGAVRWEAVRDGGLNTDEIPAGVLVLPDGVTVVTGRGGPNLPGGYIPGVTVGYSPSGALLWEAFSTLATVWATALPNGDVCATGGYDALITCWRPAGGAVSTPTATLPGPTNTPTLTPLPPTPTSTALPPTPTTTSAPLAAPSSLAASALNKSQIKLTWTNNAANQDGVKIERCLGSKCTNFSQIASVVGTTATYTNSGLAANTSYRYRVRAYNAAGNSAYSNSAGAKTPRR